MSIAGHDAKVSSTSYFFLCLTTGWCALQSCRLLTGASPVVVTARRPRSWHPVHQEFRIALCVKIGAIKVRR